MLFNSYEFIFFFLPLTFLLYFFLLRQKLATGAKGFLVFASLFFYSWWNIAYLPLILGSMLFNYIVGNSLNENLRRLRVHKKSLLAFGISVNVLLLGYYKYADFFLENLNALAGTSLTLLHLALPLAISFFTFQQIAYLVDSYRGETKEYDFLNYALFVTFFPQLIAGPIVHHAEMMPQFASGRNLVRRYKNIAPGLFIFAAGLFKKVVIADTFAVWANSGYAHAAELNTLEAWAASLSYTFELYFDFSGYTDMAIGAALLFNIRLPFNFNSPYKALSIQDFWHRWHITLSRFLRDYIYIPLGGNRHGHIHTYLNLFVTFLIGGIWHGAGWTFVFWGLLHGVGIVVHRIWKQLGKRMPTVAAWFVTFGFINITWVFFRAKDWQEAMQVLSAMFSFSWPSLPLKTALSHLGGEPKILVWILLAFVLVLFFKNSNTFFDRFKPTGAVLAVSLVLTYLALEQLSRFSEFLYFNF